MPSPATNGLKILIRKTKWLEPVQEPLDLPSSILPGESILVPGTLKAFIRNDFAHRDLGTVLHVQDTVALTAYSVRLQRALPEFNGAVPILYQYPLVMSVPRYLDCVAKGDSVKFTWTVILPNPD